ncbi:MAG TPA: glycosyltransferase [Flexivirga sp.]|uniref:glycosyltransferase n=1 Tax=Flexivirga sp. TaxID=1962927 RepID=UPI002BBE9CA5|nr:glycosyltransferase [Flexivirga sp.]HWC22815.1 glycosyltransferase [Flexivirga sp.]
MRILMATDTYPPDVSGSAVFARRLARGMSGLGHEVHVVCSSENGPNKLLVDDEGVRIHRLASLPLPVHPPLRFASPIGARRRLRDLLADIRPEVLHAQDHFTIGRAAIRAATECGIPVVATNHFMPQNLTPYLPPPCRPLVTRAAWADFRRIYRTADRVTAPTPAAAALVRRHGLPQPIEPISCGVDIDTFHPPAVPGGGRRALGLPDAPTIGYVGRLDADKHVIELIRAIARLADLGPAQLVLVGSGARRHALEKVAADVGVTNRVHFLGFVPDAQLPQVYSAFDAFCMPGTAELQSIATLEALATGLPVVLADALALPHLVQQGANGFLYPPGDIDELARSLRTLLTCDRRPMSVVSRQIAERHAATRTVARFDEIYRRLTAMATALRAAGDADGPDRPR